MCALLLLKAVLELRRYLLILYLRGGGRSISALDRLGRTGARSTESLACPEAAGGWDVCVCGGVERTEAIVYKTSTILHGLYLKERQIPQNHIKIHTFHLFLLLLELKSAKPCQKILYQLQFMDKKNGLS